MANTTNFNWETPDDTDLVKDGAAAIRTLGSAIDTSLVDLKGGTTGQVLSKATNTDMDFTWVAQDDSNAIQNAIVDAKGDIVAASAADTPARLAVGTDNQRLVAASGEATGLKYVSDTQNTVIDAKGDLLVGSSADTLARLAVGTNDYVLTADSTATNGIKWAAAGGSGGFVGAVVYNSGNFNVSNGTWTTITWNSELIDTDGFHSTSSNTDRFTIPTGKAGKYCITMNFSISSGTSTIESYFGKNTDNFAFIGATGNATNKNFTVTRQTYVSLAEGDYVFMRLIQSTGSAQDVLGGAGQSTFSIEYLGA